MKWLKRVKENWGIKEQDAAQIPDVWSAPAPPPRDTPPQLSLVRQLLTDAERFETLSPREREVFEGLLSGKKQREIADLMQVRPTTVSFHCTGLYKKLDIHDKAHLFLRYARFLTRNERL